MLGAVKIAFPATGRRSRLPVFLFLLLAAGSLFAGEFGLRLSQPTLDRWMYPFDFEPGTRTSASTFASFDSRFDTRDAQFLLGWNTESLVPTNQPPRQYLLRRARVSVTISRDKTFFYDPTYDSYVTYMTNQPGYVPDSDLGRPIELHGAGFRGGFTADSFKETSRYGPINAFTSANITIGTRNAYAADFDATGALIDIANHVGQTNPDWTNAPFEAHPWAIGITTNAAPGELVPEDSVLTFDVDLADPLIHSYFQNALSTGRLRLFISSLSPAQQATVGGTGNGGFGSYPLYATKENALYDPPQLELDGVLVGDTDADTDGLPDDWENFYFGDLADTADTDPDGDGASNAREYATGTNPEDAASAFRLLTTSFDADGQIKVRFTVAPGRSYRVEVSPDLNSWSPAQGQLTYPASGVAEFIEQRLNLPPAATAIGFCRVVVE
jgi:hypothetical protein